MSNETNPSVPSDESARATAPRVLLVDDHEDTTELFQLVLTRRGFDVVVARSVRAALAAVADAPAFDLIVSDINLPDGNGCDLLRRLRAEQRIVAIALSGCGTDYERCREAGFDEYFSKPASVQDVFSAIRRLLGMDASTSQLSAVTRASRG